MDNIISLGFHLKISLPTRLGNNSHTLIDNIFTNNKDLDECSSVLLCDISDHLPACVITKTLVCKKQMHKYKYMTITNNSAIAINNFQNEKKIYMMGLINLLTVM